MTSSNSLNNPKIEIQQQTQKLQQNKAIPGEFHTPTTSSLFDQTKTSLSSEQSMWLKNASQLKYELGPKNAKGILYRKSKKDGRWKQSQYELIGNKLVKYLPSCQTTKKTKKIQKFMNVENFRLEKMKIEDSTNEWFGFRLTQNNKCIELFSQSKMEILGWFDSLRYFCVLTTFLNDYQMIKLLGKGNFAKVYLSRSRYTNDEYAVKAFDKSKFNTTEEDKHSLIKEIQILRKINHPGVIKMYDVYESSSHIFLVKELLKGGELMHKIKKHKKFRESQVLKIVKSLLESLQYLVGKNIMHRDIKPENLILRTKSYSQDDIDVVIGDFGLADFYKEKGGYMFSRCGTPGFVAPEVLADKIYDFKVDCFQVGVIMYILLIGHSPFKGSTYEEVVTKNFNCEVDFEFPSKIRETISPSCLDLLKRLLKKDPIQRFSAEQALKHECFMDSTETCDSDGQSPSPLVSTDIISPILNQNSLQQKLPSIQMKTISQVAQRSSSKSPFDSPIINKLNQNSQFHRRASSQFNSDGTPQNRSGLISYATGQQAKVLTQGDYQLSPFQQKHRKSEIFQMKAISSTTPTQINQKTLENQKISFSSLANKNSSSTQGNGLNINVVRSSIVGNFLNKNLSQPQMSEKIKSIRQRLTEQNLI